MGRIASASLQYCVQCPGLCNVYGNKATVCLIRLCEFCGIFAITMHLTGLSSILCKFCIKHKREIQASSKWRTLVNFAPFYIVHWDGRVVWIAASWRADVYSPLHDGCSKLWSVGELAVMDGAYKLQKEDCSLLL